MNENLRELIDDLLCKKVMYGLSAEEERKLSELQREAGVEDESESFELAAAAFATVSLDKAEPIPVALRDRILADAPAHVGSPKPVAADVPYYQNRTPILPWLGWAFAAAACLVLAVNVYYTRRDTTTANIPPTPTPSPEKKLTPGDMRQQLMVSGRALAKATLGAGAVAGVQPAGDVVWSDEMQTGYVRISGLPKNDPSKEQYQLWIVAENQNPKTPVDGGTFDITTDGEVIIPIDAKVKVQNPQAFAITVEKPGGVVVSDKPHIALGKRETS